MKITFNGNEYNANYNSQSGYYELELTAPTTGGVYNAEIEYTDLFDEEYTALLPIQILAKPQVELKLNKKFLYIFDYTDFSIKDIVELSNYELNIDEETNAVSIINIVKETGAKAKDIIAFKDNGNVIYLGVIKEVLNDNGSKLYQIQARYITNMFDRFIPLENANLIRTTGIEDFIAQTITNNYISNTDTFINLSWLSVVVKTHTTKQISVSNVENGIYNLHTWMTNCTQNYGIVYTFVISEAGVSIEIEQKELSKKLIDVKAQSISDYEETFETDIVSKVVVLYSKKNEVQNPGAYTLYLKTDRTTTTNMNDPDRAEGSIETIYTENYEDANQAALNIIKGNSYNHNITFKYNKFIPIGTPIAIKTKKSIIYNTYISSVQITQKNFFVYQCGNIRVNFIEKLKKERGN